MRLLVDVLVARRAYSSGLSMAEAAEVSGISVATVHRAIDDAGGMAVHRVLVRSGCLSLAEREEIRVGVASGLSFREIGRRLDRAGSTISREVARNGGLGTYRAVSAQHRADDAARRPKQFWFERRPLVWALVQDWLKQWWSPDQISVRLRSEFPNDAEMWVSAETIYKSIYVQGKGELRRELARTLRKGRERRQPRRPQEKAKRASPIIGMVNISERPAEADDRAIPGHWEGDLIAGLDNKTFVATLVERSTRFVQLVKIDSKHAEHVAGRLSWAAQRLPDLISSLTWDQGTELAGHKLFTVETGIPVFFCDPHSPWQRGSNENTNGLLRQYMPKGTDLSVHTQDDLDEMAASLNNRPRKTLGYMKPSERIAELMH